MGRRLITRPWEEIRRDYERLVDHGFTVQFMVELVRSIESSRYVGGIHGWISHTELAISQSSEVEWPNIEPYLKISPKNDGTVEFRYFDTFDETRQWSRIVAGSQAFERLELFFRQLRWFEF